MAGRAKDSLPLPTNRNFSEHPKSCAIVALAFLADLIWIIPYSSLNSYGVYSFVLTALYIRTHKSTRNPEPTISAPKFGTDCAVVQVGSREVNAPLSSRRLLQGEGDTSASAMADVPDCEARHCMGGWSAR